MNNSSDLLNNSYQFLENSSEFLKNCPDFSENSTELLENSTELFNKSTEFLGRYFSLIKAILYIGIASQLFLPKSGGEQKLDFEALETGNE